MPPSSILPPQISCLKFLLINYNKKDRPQLLVDLGLGLGLGPGLGVRGLPGRD
jgi:hypothetical protein